jgi:hypothetical protein
VANTRKGGRPRKAARLKRTRRLQVLLTIAEHKALSECAERRELTASEIVRGCIRSLLQNEAAKGDAR